MCVRQREKFGSLDEFVLWYTQSAMYVCVCVCVCVVKPKGQLGSTGFEVEV